MTVTTSPTTKATTSPTPTITAIEANDSSW